MYSMLFRFFMVATLLMTVQGTIANTVNGVRNRVSRQPRILIITKDFTDDNGQNVPGAIAGSADRVHMDRNYNAFSKALNSLNYDEIVIPEGRFYFRKQLKVEQRANGHFLPKKIIRGSNLTTSIYLPAICSQQNSPSNEVVCPSTILDFTYIPDRPGEAPLLWLTGSNALLESVLTRDLKQGDTSYVVSSGQGVQIDDLLILTDKNSASYGPRGGYHKGEMLKISAVQGQSISFNALHDSYKADRCEIYKINPLQIELENITLLDTRAKLPHRNSDGTIARYSSGEIVLRRAGAGLRVDQCENSKVQNVYVLDASYNAGISINNVFNSDLNGCRVVMALPNETRMDRTGDYCNWTPGDAYGIAIGDSQNIRVNNVDSRSWAHAFATGSGASGMKPIVNRQIKVTNSKFTATPAPLYWQNEQSISAFRKIGPANTHGNIEDSIFENNVLIGSGFNSGGHNISYINNEIWVDNYNEPNNLAYRHWDSAFYFNEAKSAQFKILNNRVHIRKFYQNPFHKNTNDGDFSYGEFVQFNYDGNIVVTKKASNGSYEEVELSGKIYDEGTLEISGNQVIVHCLPGESDQSDDFRTSMITILGVGANSYLEAYLANPQNPNVREIMEAMRTKMQIDVKIKNNTFLIHNNPANSKMIVAFNSNNPHCKFWTRIRDIEITENYFEGSFRVSVNAGTIFKDGSSNEMFTENVKVNGNTFMLSDTALEETLLNAPSGRFPKTRNSVVGNIIKTR